MADFELKHPGGQLPLPVTEARRARPASRRATCSRRPATSRSTRASSTPRPARPRSPSSTVTRASCATAATRSTSWPRSRRSSRSPTCSSTASCRPPTELEEFSDRIRKHTLLHEDLRRFFDGFPRDAHPMAVLSSAVSALSTFYQDSLDPFDREHVEMSTVRLMAKLPTIAAYALQEVDRAAVALPRQLAGLRRELPAHDVRRPGRAVRGRPDDGPRCSTCSSCCTPTTSRTAPPRRCGWSARATPTCSPRSRPGVNALFGPLHGGANQAVLEMLEAHPRGRRRRRRASCSGSRTRSPASSSWASATGSTRTTTRGRRS